MENELHVESKNLKTTIYYELLTILSFIIFSIIFVKINKFYLFSGADLGFHRLRLLGLVQAFKHEIFFPKINYIMAGGLGYGVPMFYGQWFLYWPAFLMSTLSLSFVQSWSLLYIFFYILSLIANYVIGKKFTSSKIRAIIFSFLLVFNPLITSIVNGDMPFAICLMMTPALFYYLWRIIYYREKKVVPLALIAAMFIKTHVLSTVIVSFLCLGWLLINFKKINISNLIILGKSILLTMLVSASFWLPLLEQMTVQKLRGSGLSDAFRFNSVQGLGTIFINSINDTITSISSFPSLSLIGIILLFSSFFFFRKGNEYNRSLFLLVYILVIISSSIFPWTYFGHTILGAVQFVGRYLVFAIVLILFASLQNTHIPTYSLIVCLFLTLFSGISQQTLPSPSNEKAISTYFSDENTILTKQKYDELNNVLPLLNGSKKVSGIAGGEYINYDANLSLDTSENVISDEAVISNVQSNYGNISFDYNVNKNLESARIIVPFLWYKGYKATYSENGIGTQPALAYDSTTLKVINDGKISIEVKNSGHVEVLYSNTLIQKVSETITLATFIVLFFLTCKNIILKLRKAFNIKEQESWTLAD